MIAYGILFLFFFQLISEFVEAIYAFGLLGTSIPPEITSVLFLFAPLLLVILPRPISGKGLALVAALVLLAGVAGAFLDTRLRMLVNGFGTACFLIYLPARLWELGQDIKAEDDPAGSGLKVGVMLGGGLAVGLGAFILLRAWNSGLYPYAETWFRLVAVVLAGIGVWQLVLADRARFSMLGDLAGEDIPDGEAPPASLDVTDPEEHDPARAGFWVTAVLSVGLVAALTLLYFALSSLGVISRWSGTNYIVVLGLCVTVLSALAAWMAGMPERQRYANPLILSGWNLLFIAILMGAILPHQVRFPAVPGLYPLAEPLPGPLAGAAALLLVVLFPVVLVNFILLASELAARVPSQRKLGGAFGLAMLFLLVMIFAQVFTTVYDYIPVVGPFFRDRFWLVYLVLGLAAALPLLVLRRVWFVPWPPLSRPVAGSVIGLGLAALIGAGLVSATPDPLQGERASLVVMTYNIQQGYTQTGSRDPQAQLRVMRNAGADLIGLQESDSARIAGGNSDLVRYFADRLDMYSYYGPKVVTGTFGIALLSRHPIENPRTFYMYSEGEQTAAIHAQVRVGGRLFNVFVTHLGNGGPLIQQENFLEEVSGLEDVIAMGDFNFRPDTEQYALTMESLEDAWLLRWPGGADALDYRPDRRIDHVFLSPGLQVRSARFHTGPESDHPALIVELGW
jgi:endonuclease/exonuclease/phosphatase family metal-dependent hydrolase